jgi:hypothetical protein
MDLCFPIWFDLYISHLTYSATGMGEDRVMYLKYEADVLIRQVELKLTVSVTWYSVLLWETMCPFFHAKFSIQLFRLVEYILSLYEHINLVWTIQHNLTELRDYYIGHQVGTVSHCQKRLVALKIMYYGQRYGCTSNIKSILLFNAIFS